jgi:protein-S-isoprenylcysteine O-methyltransferase Ste14
MTNSAHAGSIAMSETTHPFEDNAQGIKIYPPVLAGVLLIAGLLIHLIGGHHHRVVHFHQFAGLLIVAGGVGLSFYAAAIFAARNTTKDPYGEPAALVTVMPYTFTRNPMYLGLTIILLGFAVFFWSAAVVLAPVVFYFVIDRLVIPREEQALERIFGNTYLDYQRHVRRWV